MRIGVLVSTLFLVGCSTAAGPDKSPSPVATEGGAVRSPVNEAGSATPFETMQWLYGSAEGAAASFQAYSGLRDFVLAAASARPSDSVILAEGATIADPSFVPCGDRPLAVVLDVDETAVQNLGYEYDRDLRGVGYDPVSWDRWERTGTEMIAPMPGAVEALQAIRNAGVAVVFNSNRASANAPFTERALNNAGLGPAEHLSTLWLQDDAPGGSRKDARRAMISEAYCVVAMAGDQLGDFSDLFRMPVTERRTAASSTHFGRLWGNGWFLLSNPVYGPAMQGTRDEVFPPEMRWIDPGGMGQ